MTLVRPQQYRIAKLLSDGHSIRQCGETIGIAEKTVSGYLNGLFKRLGVKNSKRDGRAVVIERFRAGDLKPMRPGRGPKPRVGGGALDAPARARKSRAT